MKTSKVQDAADEARKQQQETRMSERSVALKGHTDVVLAHFSALDAAYAALRMEIASAIAAVHGVSGPLWSCSLRRCGTWTKGWTG